MFCLKFVSRFLEFSSNFKIGAKSRIFFFFSLFFLEHSTFLALSLKKKLFFVLCTRSLSSPLHPSPPFDVRSLKTLEQTPWLLFPLPLPSAPPGSPSRWSTNCRRRWISGAHRRREPWRYSQRKRRQGGSAEGQHGEPESGPGHRWHQPGERQQRQFAAFAHQRTAAERR